MQRRSLITPHQIPSPPFILLGAPYQDEDRAVIDARVNETRLAAFWIHNNGLGFVIAPNLMDYIPEYGTAHTNRQFWLNYSMKMVEKCDEYWILPIDGWDKSEGVRLEMELAEKLEKRIRLLLPSNTHTKERPDFIIETPSNLARSMWRETDNG
jgi:hypothetical protein